LSIIRSQKIELSARKARLLAERDGLGAIELPDELDLAQTETAAVVNGETRLFEGNRSNRESQKRQLELSIDQIGEEIRGLEAQRISKDDEIALLEVEHKRIKGLADRKLIESTRVYTSERDRARLMGERGE